MFRHRNFQSVIGPLTLEAAIYFNLFFNIRFNWALINRSGAIVRQRNFQSVVASLNKGFKLLKPHFIIIFFLILDLIGI